MKDYWKSTPDIEVSTEKNILRYYREAQKLQVYMPYWIDGDGNPKQGKTVAINLKALSETSEAVQLLERVLTEIKSEI